MKTNCPQCQKILSVPNQNAGNKVRCPGCKHIFFAGDRPIMSQPFSNQSFSPPPTVSSQPFSNQPIPPHPHSNTLQQGNSKSGGLKELNFAWRGLAPFGKAILIGITSLFCSLIFLCGGLIGFFVGKGGGSLSESQKQEVFGNTDKTKKQTDLAITEKAKQKLNTIPIKAKTFLQRIGGGKATLVQADFLGTNVIGTTESHDWTGFLVIEKQDGSKKLYSFTVRATTTYDGQFESDLKEATRSEIQELKNREYLIN